MYDFLTRMVGGLQSGLQSIPYSLISSRSRCRCHLRPVMNELSSSSQIEYQLLGVMGGELGYGLTTRMITFPLALDWSFGFPSS
jgi:hypothetical protein